MCKPLSRPGICFFLSFCVYSTNEYFLFAPFLSSISLPLSFHPFFSSFIFFFSFLLSLLPLLNSSLAMGKSLGTVEGLGICGREKLSAKAGIYFGLFSFDFKPCFSPGWGKAK